jgi:integrase
MVLGMSRPWKHPKTGVYWFRKVVPEAMRQLVGRVEVRQSLHTKDPREAALRFTEVAAKVAAKWTALREGPKPLTHQQAAALAGSWYRWFIPIFEADPGEDPDAWFMWSEQLHDIDMSGRPELDERDITDNTRSPATQRRIGEFLTEHGRLNAFFQARDLHLFPAQLPAFMDALETEFHAAMRLLARRAGRDYRPDKRPERFPEWQPSAPPKEDPAAAVTPTLTGILEGWWREAKATGRKPSTYESYSNTTSGLVAFLGHDDAKRVTPEDVVRFKDHRLSSINPRTGKPISAKTVKDSDLSGLKTLFGWAVSNRKLTTNPVAGLTIKLGKPQKLRGKGLTEEEAKAILSAASKVTRGGESAGTFAAKRWVPFLAAYTGARVGELAQLRKQDATREGEHWVLLLTPEAGTIKTNEARKVVLHPHLIDLGFPAFLRAAPPGHLFLKPAKDGDVLGPLQGLKNRLSEFVRTVITDPNVAPMHGFRHRFKTIGLEAGISTRVLDAIQGHAARTAGDSYGDVTVKAMAQAMEKVPRVDV